MKLINFIAIEYHCGATNCMWLHIMVIYDYVEYGDMWHISLN